MAAVVTSDASASRLARFQRFHRWIARCFRFTHDRVEELERSLAAPHEESEDLAEAGLPEWAARVPETEGAELVDLAEGTEVRWSPGEAWSERRS